MKKIVIIVICALSFGCANTNDKQPTITSFETSGNLKSTKSVGCEPLSNLTTMYTPADIYPGLAACIKDNNIEYGSRLFFLAGTYGRYDTLRVKDATSHQGLVVLQIRAYKDLDKSDVRNYMKELKKEVLKNHSQLLLNICGEIEEFGRPEYYPDYMIQHGLDAFNGNSKDALKQDFDEASGWKMALNGYMHCNNSGHR